MGFKYRRLLLGGGCALLASSAITNTGVITAHAAGTPTVTSVSPASGSTEGGQPVTITGTGFQTGVTVISVQFGIINVASANTCPPPVTSSAGCFTVISDTTINAWTPAHKAAVLIDVAVTTDGFQSLPMAGDKFTYTAPTPKPVHASPSTGPGGAVITLTPTTGTNELSGYDFATSVDFNPQPSGAAVSVTTTPCTGTPPPGGCFDIVTDTIVLHAPSTGTTLGTVYDITVTTAGGMSTKNGADTFTFTGDVYRPTAPFRLADTRNGSGQPLAGQHLGTGQADFVPVVGVDGVPSNATAAVLNVTTTGGTAPSFLTVYPGATSVPSSSNLNFLAGQTIANLVTVPIGINGGVNVFNHAGTTDAIVDLEGYFIPATGANGLYNPLNPARISDTRPGSGQPNSGQTLNTGSVLVVQVDGAGAVPASGVSAVVLNVTAVNSSLPSFLTAYGDGGRPNASNLNFTPGTVVPNRVIVPVSSVGTVNIFNQQGRVDVVVDVGGWFSNGTPTTGFHFTPLPPTRIADTRPRSGQPLAGRTLSTGSTLSVPTETALSGVPAGAMAVVANVTVANTTGPSFLIVYPDLTTRPVASDLNWVAGQVVPNLVITAIQSSNGAVAVFNHFGNVDVIVDVFGFWS